MFALFTNNPHALAPFVSQIDMRRPWYLRSINYLLNDFTSIRHRRTLVVGARVVLENMARDDMNGKVGTIVGAPHEGEDDLVKVKLDGGGRNVKVKTRQVGVRSIVVGGGGEEAMERV